MPFPILVAFIRCHVNDCTDGRAPTYGIEQVDCSNHIGRKRIDGRAIGFPDQRLGREMIDDLRHPGLKKGFDLISVPNIEILDIELGKQIRFASEDRSNRLQAKAGNARSQMAKPPCEPLALETGQSGDENLLVPNLCQKIPADHAIPSMVRV
jgi:hypothetical protein